MGTELDLPVGLITGVARHTGLNGLTHLVLLIFN